MLESILGRAGCTAEDGRFVLPEGRTLTLYLARDGGSLQVSKLCEVTLRESVVEALDNKGELFFLALEDLFAGSVTADARTGPLRKAGFLG